MPRKDSVCGAQVGRPDGRAEQLGLGVLNEPAAEQADPTVLDLQLRVLTKEIQAWRISTFILISFFVLNDLDIKICIFCLKKVAFGLDDHF